MLGASRGSVVGRGDMLVVTRVSFPAKACTDISNVLETTQTRAFKTKTSVSQVALNDGGVGQKKKNLDHLGLDGWRLGERQDSAVGQQETTEEKKLDLGKFRQQSHNLGLYKQLSDVSRSLGCRETLSTSFARSRRSRTVRTNETKRRSHDERVERQESRIHRSVSRPDITRREAVGSLQCTRRACLGAAKTDFVVQRVAGECPGHCGRSSAGNNFGR